MFSKFATADGSENAERALTGASGADELSNHVIGVCLPSQSASKMHNQEKKARNPLRTT